MAPNAFHLYAAVRVDVADIAGAIFARQCQPQAPKEQGANNKTKREILALMPSHYVKRTQRVQMSAILPPWLASLFVQLPLDPNRCVLN